MERGSEYQLPRLSGVFTHPESNRDRDLNLVEYPENIFSLLDTGSYQRLQSATLFVTAIYGPFSLSHPMLPEHWILL